MFILAIFPFCQEAISLSSKAVRLTAVIFPIRTALEQVYLLDHPCLLCCNFSNNDVFLKGSFMKIKYDS